MIWFDDWDFTTDGLLHYWHYRFSLEAKRYWISVWPMEIFSFCLTCHLYISEVYLDTFHTPLHKYLCFAIQRDPYIQFNLLFHWYFFTELTFSLGGETYCMVYFAYLKEPFLPAWIMFTGNIFSSAACLHRTDIKGCFGWMSMDRQRVGLTQRGWRPAVWFSQNFNFSFMKSSASQSWKCGQANAFIAVRLR